MSKEIINQRFIEVINFLISEKKVPSKSFLAEKFGISASKFSEILKERMNVGIDLLSILIDDYNINSEWLLTGKGEMLKSEREKIVEELEKLPKGELKIKEYPTKLAVRLVTLKAQAGWCDGYYADEYLEDMPIMMIDSDKEYKGEYLAFEVQGDSMEPDYMEGDVVICRKVQRHLWSYKLHYKDWDFVIAHATQGIMLKEIIDHKVEKGIITCHSINPEHKDFKINLREVTYLYNVVEVRQKGSRKRWNRAKDFYIDED